MNDRSVSVLEQYEVEILNLTKGRNSYICDTAQGKYILEEYKGRTEKLPMMESLQRQLIENGCCKTDILIRNKEGDFFCKDAEGSIFIVKEYCAGRECSVKNKEELLIAMEQLACLHNAMDHCQIDGIENMRIHSLQNEVVKHNKELKHVRKYLRQRSDKTEFERALLSQYYFFLEKALNLEERLMIEQGNTVEEKSLKLCHGEYQYHNILLGEDKVSIIHFESFHRESCIKDVYLFLRKVMEKYNWSLELWEDLLAIYQKRRKLTVQDYRELYYRFAYPEKFWKIVDFYMNNRKSWQPEKNLEKIKKVIEQETEKDKILHNIRKHVD